MKIRITFLSLLAVSAALVASAQEHDDMYFNSKDRIKVQASRPLTLKNINSEHEVATAINPTDSYSARNVNPEYLSQSKVNPSGSAEPAPYFIPDYTPTAINQNLNGNSSSSWNNCNCAAPGNYPYSGMMTGYGSPYGSYYPSMSSMYGYNPYSYGGYNGFNSGWSSMTSIGFGMGMGSYYPYGGSSWGMGYGMGGSLFNYGFNYYGGGYGYNSYYPNNVVIINNDNNSRNLAYGKRVSRSSDLNNMVNSSDRNATMVTTDSQGRVRGSNGRIAGDGNTNADSYYQRGWRTNPETNSAIRSTYSNGTRSGSDGSGLSNRSNFGSESRSNSSFFDNSSRSSSNMNSGSNFSNGGSRSGGAVGGGSSSGARRGRD